MMSKKLLKRFWEARFLLVLILAGTVAWSLTMVKSGRCWDAECASGVGFWGPNGHDGVWHLAVINSLARGSSEMPIFAGEQLKNYHLGFDLILALISKLTGIIPVNLYFQIVPPILALLIGVLTYKFVLLWRGSVKEALWSTFFVYFGGSWGWVVTLVRDGEIGGESMFWSQQAISTLINPPLALSLVFILLGLIFLLKHQRLQTTYYLLLATLFFGILIEVKAYAGILVIIGLFLATIWNLLFTTSLRSDVVKVLSGTFLISLVFYLLLNKGSENLVIFQPFWFLETMMGLTDRVGWLQYHSAMTTYRFGNILIKAIPAYVLAFLIFWLGNLGTRIISHWWLVINGWKETRIDFILIFLLSIVAAGAMIPMLFLQKGTPWNTIQFFYYSLFFLGILAGTTIGRLLSGNTLSLHSSRVWTGLSAFLVVFLTIPTTISTLAQVYLPNRPPAMISKTELEALAFLSREPDGIVLTYPFDRAKAKEAEANPPRPLYLYESTAYVSAFSGKTTFLEDEVNLDITGYGWSERRKEVEEFYNSLDQKFVWEFLRKNNTKYVYWLKGQRAKLGETQLGITKIFENEEVDIYRVQ